MKNARKLIAISIFMLILSFSLIACTADDEPTMTDEEKIEQAISGFYEALQEGNTEEALSYVYGHESASDEKKESHRQIVDDTIRTGGDDLQKAHFSIKQIGFPEEGVAVAIMHIVLGEVENDFQQFLVSANDSWKIDIASIIELDF